MILVLKISGKKRDPLLFDDRKKKKKKEKSFIKISKRSKTGGIDFD